MNVHFIKKRLAISHSIPKKNLVLLKTPKKILLHETEELDLTALERDPFVASIARGVLLPKHPDALFSKEAFIRLFEKIPRDRAFTYAIATERKDKYYPFDSREILSFFAQAVGTFYPHSRVSLKNPQLRLDIEIAQENVFLSLVTGE